VISVVQRVRSAEVRVDGRTVGSIEHGLLALVAVVSDDEPDDVAYIADRLGHLRIFADSEGRMNLSVQDVGGSLLLVSQFTLAADTRKGRRPSFDGAAAPDEARRLFEELLAVLSAGPVPVQTGEFAADMQITLVNDGPVTLIVDSRKRRAGGGERQGGSR